MHALRTPPPPLSPIKRCACPLSPARTRPSRVNPAFIPSLSERMTTSRRLFLYHKRVRGTRPAKRNTSNEKGYNGERGGGGEGQREGDSCVHVRERMESEKRGSRSFGLWCSSPVLSARTSFSFASSPFTRLSLSRSLSAFVLMARCQASRAMTSQPCLVMELGLSSFRSDDYPFSSPFDDFSNPCGEMYFRR